ncbi:Hippocampus abundant transcript 1 protein [Sesamum angolense]|uniref:Hippocampus abundant transcript 1 protein n=1 Tax=Sesamum angolense TaxID=2727404 RepID=A0AAE1X5A5_9LAMI|nr:Hippocampus abundant transcript 1 protein [Sesamum angolense]
MAEDYYWKSMRHLFVTVFLSLLASRMVLPAIPDVTVDAVCAAGKDRCSLAIYLSGFQQAISGLGSVFLMPVIGNLSDVYGRKLLLTFPLTFSIFPLGGVMCLALSFLADNVAEEKRVSAFGLLAGVESAAALFGTLAARFLPTTQIFQVAAVASITALVYMRIFLEDTTHSTDALEQPILNSTTEAGNKPLKTTDFANKIPLPKDIIRLLKSSTTVSLASFVAFFLNIAEAAVIDFLMYYLKARFHFQKDQFADLSLITYIGAVISNTVIVPLFGPLLGEETLLCIGLFSGFINMLLESIAWSSWVPYASAFLGIFLSLATPTVRCIISKQVGLNEQGIAQGCLMGIFAFANVVSPVIYSPISALSLSGRAPFNFPGFSMLCIGLSWLVGFIISIGIKVHPLLSRGGASIEHCTLA